MWNHIAVEHCLTFPVSRNDPSSSGLQENVIGNKFSTFDSSREHPQRIQSDNVQRN